MRIRLILAYHTIENKNDLLMTRRTYNVQDEKTMADYIQGILVANKDTNNLSFLTVELL